MTDFAPETIPQIEGLAWNKIFPEKEFLFHVFTGLGYKAAGEKGVLVVCMLIGTFIVFSIYLVNTQSLSPFLALIPTLLLTLASSKFLIRIFSVRPQILGVLFAILLVGALLQRRHRLAGIISMLFALSYHAVYIPIALATVACIATFAVERDLKAEYFRNTMKCLISTVAGIIIGLLINPYFPSNIMMGIQHLKIALLSAGLPMSHFGVELQSVSGSSLLRHLPGFFTLLAIGLIALGYFSAQHFKNEKTFLLDPTKKDAFIGALTTFGCFALFLAITIHSPRGNEYLVPFASLFIVRLAMISTNKLRFLAIVSCGVFLLQIPDTKHLLGSLAQARNFYQPEEEPLRAKAALADIPVGTDKNRVFNCSWDVSPFLFYTRPDLVFIDVLDPSFLYSSDPDFYLTRHRWFNGEISDSFGFIKDSFNADYIFCRDLPISNQLKSDPHFELLYPKSPEDSLKSEFTVFALKSERPAAFVRQFNYSEKLVLKDSVQSQEEIKTWPGDIGESLQPIFIDLQQSTSSVNVSGADIACADIQPLPSEIERLKGATVIGLGGGPHLQLWVNNKLTYAHVTFSAPRRTLHSLVEIEEPITANTKLHVRVCGNKGATYFGAAMSLWKKDALREICANRKDSHYDYIPAENAKILERSDIECLAPLVNKS